ncbi:hypothetical protein POM88_004014 [Heracleum sosnowskyi]|uniref:DUF7086 domain-containing protein n=1 Tax=Heracleum sosnowskyi TaxID=360622 RepID=A0AAD8JHK9_9APIA|nr:hypothetical protein POM88_004014 [Heracleum sosnowskyi]
MLRRQGRLPLGLKNSLLDLPDTIPSTPEISLSRSGPLRNPVVDSSMGQNEEMPVRNIQPLKTPSIDPLFEWASNVKCKVNKLATLTTDKIGLQVKCMECRKSYKVWLDLHTGLRNVVDFVQASRSYEVPIPSLTEMPRQCRECHKISILEPVHAKKKRNLNWLGLLLAHELGSLSYDQLVYYCRHRGLPWHKCIKPQLVRLCFRDLVHQLGLKPISPP